MFSLSPQVPPRVQWYEVGPAGEGPGDRSESSGERLAMTADGGDGEREDGRTGGAR
jgi:hypothetical protein